jgi:hypothetical protein
MTRVCYFTTTREKFCHGLSPAHTWDRSHSVFDKVFASAFH